MGYQPLYISFEGKMFLNVDIMTDQLKRAINIRCTLQFFYVESCIKSSKQGRVIVCFNMLSFSFAFTLYQHILLTRDT